MMNEKQYIKRFKKDEKFLLKTVSKLIKQCANFIADENFSNKNFEEIIDESINCIKDNVIYKDFVDGHNKLFSDPQYVKYRDVDHFFSDLKQNIIYENFKNMLKDVS